MDDENVLIAAHFAESEGVQFQPWYWRLGEKMEFARDMIEENDGSDALMAFACQSEVILR